VFLKGRMYYFVRTTTESISHHGACGKVI
jgi:hypothetical protein